MVAKNLIKLSLSFYILSSILVFSTCSSDGDGDLKTVDEGIFINEIYASGEDWVELYNSNGSAKDISGYIIHDDGETEYELPNGTSVPANGYLVIFCDDLNTELHTNFKLSSDGETVTLLNATNEIVSVVKYPKLDNGQSYGRYPDGSETLSISGITSKGTSNNESNAPAILTVFRTPTVPALNQAVDISAEIQSSTPIGSVKLFYSFEEAAFTSITMNKVGSYYTATIPAQGAGVTGTMEYYVEAKSTTGATTYKPFDAPANTNEYILNNQTPPQLYINEIMASQTDCCADESGDFDDWFEIYNSTNSSIDLGGMYVSDDLTDPFKSKIPDGVTIPAHGFLVFWADEQGSQGDLHVNFKLSKGGEAVGLFFIDGRTIDSKTFGDQDDNKSFGRNGDGAGTWIQFTNPTQGTSNN